MAQAKQEDGGARPPAGRRATARAGTFGAGTLFQITTNGAGNTLLGDLLNKVADKYEALYNFPALSPTMNALATTLQQRAAYNASGVVATRNANNTVTLSVTKGARIPVTGLVSGGIVSYTGAAPTVSSETYAGQRITYVTLAAGASVTLKRN